MGHERMARLAGPEDRSLELTPLGYEFPEIPRGFDAEWLVVRLRADDGRRQWGSDDPCLTTRELRRLARWLRDLAECTPGTRPFWGTLENNLEFRAAGSGDSTTLIAELDSEWRPDGHRHDDNCADDAPCWEPARIEFRPGVAGLRRFADELDEALREFPDRLRGS